MKQIAFYFALAVIVITGISHAILGFVIAQMRDAAVNNPKKLKGVTPKEALAKVAQWELTRKRLWPSALFVAGGALLLALVS